MIKKTKEKWDWLRLNYSPVSYHHEQISEPLDHYDYRLFLFSRGRCILLVPAWKCVSSCRWPSECHSAKNQMGNTVMWSHLTSCVQYNNQRSSGPLSPLCLQEAISQRPLCAAIHPCLLPQLSYQGHPGIPEIHLVLWHTPGERDSRGKNYCIFSFNIAHFYSMLYDFICLLYFALQHGSVACF